MQTNTAKFVTVDFFASIHRTNSKNLCTQEYKYCSTHDFTQKRMVGKII